MICPTILRARLYAAVCGIPEVVNALNGDVANIVEFLETGDLYSAVNNLTPPGLLIACQGFHPAAESQRLTSQDFWIVVKTNGDPFELTEIILGGYTQSSGFDQGLSLRDLPIHPRYHQMEKPTLARQSISVDAKTNYDFWAITTSFLSRGAE